MNNRQNHYRPSGNPQRQSGGQTPNSGKPAVSPGAQNYPGKFNPTGKKARAAAEHQRVALEAARARKQEAERLAKQQAAAAKARRKRQAVQHTAIRITASFAALLLAACFLSSGDKMNLAPVTSSANDRDTVFEAASANLLSASLSEIYSIPKLYVLEQNNEPTPIPAAENFVKTDDPERKNYDGSPIDYYFDDTIEVKCWKEKRDGTIFNFAEVEIAHPSQFRRKLVDDVISKKHLDYPLNIFKKMNGVVGMSADYCAFRSYGIIVQYGSMVRETSNGMLDIMIYDKDGNLSYIADKDFTKSAYYNSSDVIYTFAFGPMLVDDYEINKTDRLDNYLIGEVDRIYPRAAIGQFGYDKHYLLCTVDYASRAVRGTTVRHLAEVMQEKGVRFAYNMDGGQTAALMYHNELFNQVAYGGQREVSDILFFATAVPNE